MKRRRYVFVCVAVLLAAAGQTAMASTLDRTLDPVILKGADLIDCFTGSSPDDIVAFRYQGDSWEQIPVQADEMATLDIVTPYGPYAAAAGYPPPTGVNVLFYIDVDTYTGADPDTSFDDNDELVFMAKDSGGEPTSFTYPEGVISGSACKIIITDPLDGGTGYVYLFEQDGTLDPDASTSYVDYQFHLIAGTYPDDYSIAGGFNPEETTITTSNYSHHFSDLWINDGLEIYAGLATGTDILDRHQNYFAPGNCARTEDTFSQGEGCFVTNKSGPIRVIRSYMGANSGPLTQRTNVFYEGRQDIVTDLRVHEINGVYDVFDYEPAATGMVYYSNLNTTGLQLDGVPETANTGLLEWEFVTGMQGSLVLLHDLESDLLIGTEADIDSYWEDDSSNPVSDCTGDGLAYGTSGVALLFVPSDNICTDPLGPGCNNLRYVKAKRHIYYDEPGITTADAAQYWNRLQEPLTIVVEPVDDTCTDNDGDGYYPQTGCATPLDCNDANENIYPTNLNTYCDCEGPYPEGTTEVCSGDADEDCDGLVDNEDPECQGYSSAANAEASAYGSESLTGSGAFNGLALLLIPVGAVLFLRILRRKR